MYIPRFVFILYIAAFRLGEEVPALGISQSLLQCSCADNREYGATPSLSIHEFAASAVEVKNLTTWSVVIDSQNCLQIITSHLRGEAVLFFTLCHRSAATTCSFTNMQGSPVTYSSGMQV